MATNLTQERLKEVFSYDPLTGLFTRRVATCNTVKVGDVATCKSRGYVVIRLDGKLHKANRLAWLYMTGQWPVDFIDHINGVSSDDRWSNLRAATNKLNSENEQRARRNNKCGYLGVSPTPTGKFVACIITDGRKKHLGTFSRPDAAHQVYLTAKRHLHAGCTI